MSVVKLISEWPRPQIRQAPQPQPPRSGTAEIHILPCIRREPMQLGEHANNFADAC